MPPEAPTFAEKSFQPVDNPGCVPGAGSVVLLPPVGANLLRPWDAAPLAESRCHAQISSAAESQLQFGSSTVM